MGRVLAIDYGEKRTGIAITDPLQIVASGLTTVDTNSLIDFLKNYCSEENVDLFVVGLPKQMNNQPSLSESLIKPFIIKLKSSFPKISIVRIDERFTSKIALRTMIDSGLKKKQRKNKSLVDQISATLILQSYLDSK
tara:strand:- start:635 stop:1045 length:411 start_codon:yes stop_codon:yes gene_type:complete